MSNILKKIFSGTAGELIEKTGSLIDQVSTSDKEKLEAKAKLAEIVMGALTALQQSQAKVLEFELTGNTLQRNWRPLVMLTFAFIIVYRYFISPVFGLPAIELPDQFWDLLQIAMGGYIIGRSVEKSSDKFTRNVDLSFLKKKDRS
jgi:hypothetical protein